MIYVLLLKNKQTKRTVVGRIGENDTATSKPVLAYVTDQIAEIEEDYNDELKVIVKHAVDEIRRKYTYFPAQVSFPSFFFFFLYPKKKLKKWISKGHLHPRTRQETFIDQAHTCTPHTHIHTYIPLYIYKQLVKLVRVLAELHQAEEEWREAGRAMASVDTEDQYFVTVMTKEERCEWRIATAQYFLQDEDNTAATTHIQKARKLLREIPLTNEGRQKLDLQQKVYTKKFQHFLKTWNEL
ncbi:hypothetical protein RFI_16471 [Reticulomyxa filosa]|uniref:Uncharacterized protein n=1 Tax=Reticulomyxa filosa TaxID=46433 RepID=X6N3W9_RETFI|nr:hypothetical protein RFI_16471 [Reticulomyxa filosa]|eukprot:ETO20746.1 hypothetical protein RFI_16471 [Reticulomyxa filosa]